MNTSLIGIIVVFLVVLFSMVLHEMAHGYVAYWLGDNTAKDQGRLTLNPLAHIDPVMSIIVPLLLYISGLPVFGGAKPVPINSKNLKSGAWGMALVGLAGPLTNFLLALIGFLIGHFTGLLYDGGLWGLFFMEMVYCNLSLCVFNLIPLTPLDGSRVLYAIAPDGIRDFMDTLESRGGIWIVLIIVTVFSSALSRFTSGAMDAILDFFYLLVGGK